MGCMGCEPVPGRRESVSAFIWTIFFNKSTDVNILFAISLENRNMLPCKQSQLSLSLGEESRFFLARCRFLLKKKKKKNFSSSSSQVTPLPSKNLRRNFRCNLRRFPQKKKKKKKKIPPQKKKKKKKTCPQVQVRWPLYLRKIFGEIFGVTYGGFRKKKKKKKKKSPPKKKKKKKKLVLKFKSGDPSTFEKCSEKFSV